MDDFAFRLPTLFEDGCCDCPARDVCPGDAWSPCACKWPSPPRRYQCDSCHVICRVRGVGSGSARDEDFIRRLKEGLWFNDVSLDQRGLSLDLPRLIPLRARDLDATTRDRLRVVGVDLEDLLTEPDADGETGLKGRKSGRAIRDRLGVRSSCEIVVVLNGDDDRLRGLWGLDRLGLLRELKSQGVRIVTGPTFSVYDDEPASHSSVMLMRHLRVLAEIQSLGLCAVPNLYWRGAYDLRAWADWLQENPGVHLVSRDFSRTKNWEPFKRQFDGLISILRRVGRPLHVLLLGVGAQKSEYAFSRLRAVRCGGTLATANPVVAAQRGRRLVVYRGSFEEAEDDAPRDVLARDNVLAIDRYLAERGLGSDAPLLAPEPVPV